MKEAQRELKKLATEAAEKIAGAFSDYMKHIVAAI